MNPSKCKLLSLTNFPYENDPRITKNGIKIPNSYIKYHGIKLGKRLDLYTVNYSSLVHKIKEKLEYVLIYHFPL